MPSLDWGAIRESAMNGFTLSALPPTLELPALPHAVAKFVERARDEAASLKELASIVETDAGLTLELLKHVNSAFVGLRQKAKNVQQALSLLGVRQSKMFLITTGTQAAVRARKSKLINQASFWNASLQKALFARHIARMLKTDHDLAFAGALLQDYLLPVLTNELYERYVDFVERRAHQPETLTDYEHEALNWDHATAGACLAHRWKLPDELVCCILYHDRGLSLLADPVLGRSFVAAVALSALLPDQLRQHFTGLEQLSVLQSKWPAFDLMQIATQVDAEHAELGGGVANEFPLARRCKQMLEREEEPAAATVA
ncbi:MAG TPA: HDOD domain-containing protein [Planctomycetaceae bacterium]|nr:HDOD domain-containing protein [Planctomycetaceae bacterium]